MSEDEWLTSADPQAMLAFLIAPASDRKLRLAGVACCRRVWDVLPEGLQGREAVEVAEVVADGAADERRHRAAEEAARDYAESLCENTEPWVGWAGLPPEAWAAQAAANALDEGAYRSRLACRAAHGAKAQQEVAAGRSEHEAQAHLLRCIFGNPFCPSQPAAHSLLNWHGGAVPRLAQTIYDDRLLPSGHLDAARLAVLADMIEEAGCCDADLLGHLRSAGPHVRGCHGLDAILGRA